MTSPSSRVLTGDERDAVIRPLLGLPYSRDRRHCWWLACHVSREVFGRALPLGPELCPDRHARVRLLAEHPERRRWRQHQVPDDGDLILMARAPGRAMHCGVFLGDRGAVIHTDEPHGVVLDSVVELEQSRRWRLSFHRPEAAP